MEAYRNELISQLGGTQEAKSEWLSALELDGNEFLTRTSVVETGAGRSPEKKVVSCNIQVLL